MTVLSPLPSANDPLIEPPTTMSVPRSKPSGKGTKAVTVNSTSSVAEVLVTVKSSETNGSTSPEINKASPDHSPAASTAAG